ncbi:MAG: HAD family phosphatase [Candidatus Omnitrophota bacterium]
MKCKLIVFDIDGTITRHISSWRYIHEKLRLWSNRAFRYQEDFFAGKITYRRFCELDAAHWKGMRISRIRSIFKRLRYSKNAPRAIAGFKKAGFKLAAVSTGLQFMTDRVRSELKFDYAVSNRLISRNGLLTGGVKINLEHGAKHTVLAGIYRKFSVKPHQVISVGDTEGDIPLARHSGYSIAFNCSSAELKKVADYTCKTDDFNEVYAKIMEVAHE